MKKFILFLSLIVFSISIIAQDDGFYGSSKPEAEESKKQERQHRFDKWAFGGNFWLSFGSSAYVELSPIALYRVTPKLMLGPGFKYIYYKYNYMNKGKSIYGPRLMTTYTLFSGLNEKIGINIGNIVLHSEYEYLNTSEVNALGYITENNIWISNLLVGGGIFQPFGNRGGVSIMLLYNIIENKNSSYFYSNPEFRIGFYF